MRILIQSHSAKKLRKGDPLGFLKLFETLKNLKGGPFGDKQNSKKSRTVPKKNPKGDPLGTSGFVGFLEKV